MQEPIKNNDKYREEMWNQRAATFPSGIDPGDDAMFRLLEEFRPLKGASILDAGCGNGRYDVEFIRRGAARVVGVELSPKMAERGARLAEENGMSRSLRIIVSPWEEVSAADFPEAPFDFVTAIHTPASNGTNNVDRMLGLCETGVLIQSFLDRNETIYTELCRIFGVSSARFRGDRLWDLANEYYRRGYRIHWRTIERRRSRKDPVMSSLLRYSDWLFGDGKTDSQVEALRRELERLERENFPRETTTLDGLLFIEKKSRSLH